MAKTNSIRITQASVDAAKPADKDLYLWDRTLTGFGLKVTPQGGKTFFIQYKAPKDRRTRRVTIGTAAKVSASAARKEAEKIRTLLREGKDPAELKQAAREAWTVTHAIARFIGQKGIEGRKKTTIDEYERVLTKYLPPRLQAAKVATVTRGQIKTLHTEVGEKHGQTQANVLLRTLKSFFSYLVDVEQAPSNPCDNIKQFNRPKRERFLSAAELARLGDALRAEAEVHPVPAAIIRLLILTGMRHNEVKRLTWNEVDMLDGVIRLKDSKTGAKVVPVSAAALEVLNEAAKWRLVDNPYVFPAQAVSHQQGAGGHFVGLQKAWTRISVKAGLEGVRIHDLRHSFASAGASNGEGLLVLAKVLGHAQTATTERYSHLSTDPVKAAAERISNTLAAQLDGTPKATVTPLKR